jgi:hypothetical protein
MVRLTTRQLRLGVVPALAFVVAALWVAAAQGQMRPPHGGSNGGGFQGRMPGMGGPLFENVWKCGHCGKEVGRGNTPPASCPYCGVRFINGFGPSDPQYNNGNQPAPNNGAMPPNSGQSNNPNPNPMPGMMPPNNQNSGQAPQGGVQANAAPVQPPGQAALPPVVNEPPAFEDPPAAENVAAGGFQGGTGGGRSASGSRLPLATRVFIGVAAILAALVLLVVGGIVVYNVAVNNAAEPARRPRKRRRLAEVD